MAVRVVDRREQLETWRCPRCGRILAKLRLAPGSQVVVKCGCNNVSEKSQTT